jgi:hypothetical protein
MSRPGRGALGAAQLREAQQVIPALVTEPGSRLWRSSLLQNQAALEEEVELLGIDAALTWPSHRSTFTRADTLQIGGHEFDTALVVICAQ